jgi:poly(3-hydroxybutyrate) depolymerase
MILVSFLITSYRVVAAVNYTVSGMSSGGYMTGQLHVAHSASITAVGIVTAGPYYCAQDFGYDKGSTICEMNDKPLDVAASIAYATTQSSKGTIDPVSNLANSKVYIFSGSNDELMLPTILEGTYNFYKALYL